VGKFAVKALLILPIAGAFGRAWDFFDCRSYD